MAEMSPGFRDKFIKVIKLGHLKMAKVMFLIISAIVCIVIFYANTNIIGRRSLFALFLNNRSEPVVGGFDDQTNLIIENTNPTLPLANAYASSPTEGNRKALIIKSLLIRPPASKTGALEIFNITGQTSDYNIFVIYTKENYQLHVKFELFARSLLKFSTSDVLLYLHVLTDENSAHSVDQMLEKEVRRYRRAIMYTLYSMRLCAERVVDIVNSMTPYFSSTPKSYYSDSLFFLSLGLHRIADESMERAVLLDCDIVFRADVRLLFAEFERFSKENLFGLAPELTPVYRHILYRYRANFPNTDFGSPFYMTPNEIYNLVSAETHAHKIRKSERHLRHGYPGLNSGVVLLHLRRIRHSRLYHDQLQETAIRKLTSKYMFKGHLGDQDFFTLLGYEFPNLIYRLDCVWNRQLCTWWKDHGYSDVFDKYFTCKGRIKMYHGNCNARVPE
uniref:Xyloside xylosyltransferase 1 n=1 Tax=Glossina brevipalpis TaxID=37001 RepID=A0A1A9WP50_9MUSC